MIILFGSAQGDFFFLSQADRCAFKERPAEHSRH